MNVVNNKIKQRLYSLSFLATTLWVGMVALLTVALTIYDQLQQVPYYWILLYTSVVSLAGCIAWSFSWPYWRKVLITTTTLYLMLYLLKFYKHTLTWSEEPFWEAIKYVFYMHWLLITGYLSKGLVMEASIITFIEWVMPALQLILLVKFVSFSNLSFKRNS